MYVNTNHFAAFHTKNNVLHISCKASKNYYKHFVQEKTVWEHCIAFRLQSIPVKDIHRFKLQFNTVGSYNKLILLY